MPYRIQAELEGGHREPDRLGVNAHDFFEPDILHDTYESEEEAHAAVHLAYLGRDENGVGVTWTIVDAQTDDGETARADLRTQVLQAETLEALRDALNEMDRQAAPDGSGRAQAYYWFLRDRMDDIPTFGGAAPSNTGEVWSWDRERLLVNGVGVPRFSLVDRADA